MHQEHHMRLYVCVILILNIFEINVFQWEAQVQRQLRRRRLQIAQVVIF